MRSLLQGACPWKWGERLRIGRRGWTPTNFTPSTAPDEVFNADELLALIAGIDDALAGGGGGVTDHGALTGLADDDHPQYLLANGSRAFTGAADLGGFAVTNVGNVDGRDVSTDGATLDAHVGASAPHGGHAALLHAAAHEFGGADELDGDALEFSYSAVNFTPSAPAQDLGDYIGGIDKALRNAFRSAATAVTGATTHNAVATERWFEIDLSGGAVTLNLAASSGFDNGETLYIRTKGATRTNTLTIAPAGLDTCELAGSAENRAYLLKLDGTAWRYADSANRRWRTIVRVTGTYVVGATEELIVATNTSGSPYGVTLPAITAANHGRRLTICAEAADSMTSNTINILTTGTDRIGNLTTVALERNYEYLTLIADDAASPKRWQLEGWTDHVHRLEELEDVAFSGAPGAGDVLLHDGSDWTEVALDSDVVDNLSTVSGAAVTDALDALRLAGVNRTTWATGRYYYQSHISILPSATTISLGGSGTIIYYPLYIPDDYTLNALVCECTTASAGKNVRMGLYSDSNGLPGTLLVDGGNVSTATTGKKTAAISLAVSAGWYWLAVRSSGGTYRGCLNSNIAPMIGDSSGVTTLGTSGAVTGWTEAGVFGAFPASATPGSSTTASAVLIAVTRA